MNRKIKGMFGNSKGFTLIELLVVIAIIGILSSIVITNLNVGRGKARDAKRISDVKQIQTALEFFFDDNGAYPAVLSVGTMVTPGYLPTLPVPPSGEGETAYNYEPMGTGCTGYHLGVTLEDANNVAIRESDADLEDTVSLGLDCAGTTVTVEVTLDGDSASCGTTATTPDQCYDVTF